MIDSTIDRKARRHAGARLAGIAAAVVVAAGAASVAYLSTRDAGTADRPSTPTAPAHTEAHQQSRDATEVERALAARPMLELPPDAAQPQPLTTQTAEPDIKLPPPATTVGAWIPGGFPDTPEGALAQLKVLNETALRGGDPDVYGRAYTALALRGAPPVEGSGLHTLLSRFRQSAGLSAGQLTQGLTVSYDVTHGLIKGSADVGRFTVVCTLGQLRFDYKGHSTAFGIGDCQALRWTGTSWRIGPGSRAAYAPAAWPGSVDSVKAGYRALTGGGAR
ncbi:hypothetical protein ABZ863_11155 [Saccharomonospora sp. NPDC046836]|uniref:hypothetical protein n=1 Tax=Saccharomonospora sp. NPDC046836 TaxID=3156921 RepID=UPI00340DD176